MKTLAKKARSKIVHSKVFAQRALGYVSLVNAGMLLFLTMSGLEKYGIDINIQSWLIPLFILGGSLLIFLGYLEDKLGFYKEEVSVTQKRNVVLSDIMDKVTEIEKKVNSLSKK